jgi:anion-transporting  ArsA/GET3 family ATPase
MRDKIVSVFKGADRVMRGKAVDTDFWIEKYLNETQHQIKETYRYESAFNLQDYLNVLQFSPGLEELLKLRKKIYAKKKLSQK